ncbi:hypothetical protein FJY71_08360 [candidate division WOR-3 bacterium]|nr:hypothetical protein [candidate division WOR-3 bacterium]
MAAGQRPQVVVSAGTWQGAMLASDGKWALLGTTAAPGFERDDFEPADREALVAAFPEHEAIIRRLT